MTSFSTYMVDLMKDRRNGPIDAVIKSILWVISRVYGFAINIVALSYKKGIRRTYKAPLPVISVGNITLGGTGKTPLAIFVADYLLSRGRKPAILMRGYGGDENRMIEEELADVPVYAAQDRLRSAFTAKREGCDSAVLDDGFQHRRIKRDLNILLIDGISLFGNGFLFPRGILRERVTSISRADILVVTKIDGISEERRDGIARLLRDLAPGKPVVMARHRPVSLSDVTALAFAPESISAARVCVLSGIADPDYLSFLVGGLGADIRASFEYGDHHKYTQKEINAVARECSRYGIEKIITTKKDYVKLRDLDISAIEDKMLVLNIGMEILKGKEHLIAGLDSIFNGQGA